jgi:hypothetical protein
MDVRVCVCVLRGGQIDRNAYCVLIAISQVPRATLTITYKKKAFAPVGGV